MRIAKTIAAARAWILSFSCLAIIALIVITSNPFQSCVKEQYYDRTTENFDKSVPSIKISLEVYRSCLGEFTHNNAEAIIAAFTIILALSTIFLWVATRDLVEGAEQTAERQLRAYVFVKEVFIRNLDGPETPSVHIHLKNYGQTPAYKSRMTGVVKFDSFPTDDFSRDPTGEQRVLATILPPSGEQSFVSDLPIMKTEQAKRDIKTGKFAIWACGRIEYIDAFKKRRTVDFRYIFGGDTGTRVLERDGKRLGAMAQTPEGNSADDE